MGIQAAAAGEAISLKDTVPASIRSAPFMTATATGSGHGIEMQHDSAITRTRLVPYVVAGYRIGQLTPHAAFPGSARKRSTSTAVFPIPAPLNQALQRAIARTHMDQTTFAGHPLGFPPQYGP